MQLRYALLGMGLLAAPLVAQAQPLTGPYVSLGGGINFEQDTSQAFTYEPGLGIHNPGPFPITLKKGYAVSGAVGWGFGNGMRLEVEGSYRSNPLNTSFAFFNPLKYSGDDQKTSVILSLDYDIDIGLPIYPYVGVGAGVAFNKWDHVLRTAYPLIQPPPVGVTNLVGQNNITGTQPVLAIQFTAGLSYPIPGVPGLALTVDYKYFDMPNQRSFSDVLTFSCPYGGNCPVTGSAAGYGTYNAEYNHSIMVGVRYAFGGPAAAAPAAPAAPVQVPPSPVTRSFLVFFDWDKAVLTDRAKQIVAEAAAASTKVQVTKIEVNGYTDTSGTPKYNQGLSVARAKAVSAELVKDGVPASAIAIMGYGETHPLVPTGQGVREPQNRRVEIIIK